jgi:hypothetical protein
VISPHVIDELIKDEEAIQILQNFAKVYHERLEHRSQVSFFSKLIPFLVRSDG